MLERENSLAPKRPHAPPDANTKNRAAAGATVRSASARARLWVRIRLPGGRRTPLGSDGVWVVLVRGVGEALVEEVAVAVEGDEGVGVAGDLLDEFDVGAGGDEA